MDCHRQTMSSADLIRIINLPLSLQNRKVDVIILPADDSATETQKPKRRLGFIDAPPLPDSFFDPLSEEELQLWGL